MSNYRWDPPRLELLCMNRFWYTVKEHTARLVRRDEGRKEDRVAGRRRSEEAVLFEVK